MEDKDKRRQKQQGGKDGTVETSAPTERDAVKEALDIAQSFGALREKRNHSAFQVGNFDDSISLAEYIDEAERRSEPLFSKDSLAPDAPVENLEVLDIAAGFGRPDDTNDEESDSNRQSEEPSEDTRDIKLKPKVSEESKEDESGESKSDIAPTKSQSISSDSIDVEGNTEPLKVPHIETMLALPRGTSDFGDLSSEPLYELLLNTYKEKRTGVLILKRQQTVVRIFAFEGDVVMSETSSKEHELADWLRDGGYIDNQMYSDLLRETSSLNTLQCGAAVVSRGIVGPREMNRLLRKYYEFIVISAMSWVNGTWRFEKSARISAGDTSVMIESSTPSLVFQGIVRHSNMGKVDEILPKWTPLRQTGEGECRLADLGIDDVERSLLESCDGTTGVWKQILKNSLDAGRYQRLLAAFLLLRFIKIADEIRDGDIHENVEMDYFVEKSEIPDRRIGPLAKGNREPKRIFTSQVVRGVVSQKLETVKEGSYFDILEVTPTADRADIENARKKLLEIFNYEHVSELGLIDLDADIQFIRYIVDEAYEVLTHPEIGGKYRQVELGDRAKEQRSS